MKYSSNQAYQKPLNHHGKLIKDKNHPYFVYHFLKKHFDKINQNNSQVKFKLGEKYFIQKNSNNYLITFSYDEAILNKKAENVWLLNQSVNLIKSKRFDKNIQWVGFFIYLVVGFIINFLFDFNNLINISVLAILFLLMTLIQTKISRVKVLESDLKATTKYNYDSAVNFLYKKNMEDKNFIYLMNPFSRFFLTILSPVPSYLERAQNLEKNKINFL